MTYPWYTRSFKIDISLHSTSTCTFDLNSTLLAVSISKFQCNRAYHNRTGTVKMQLLFVLVCILLLIVNASSFQLFPQQQQRIVPPTLKRTTSSYTIQQRNAQSTFPPATAAASTTSTMSSDDTNKKEVWIQPQIHNSGIFRSLAILGVIAATGLSSSSPITTYLSQQSLVTIHFFTYATWFGTMFYTTFILGITMFKNLPRKTFGKLQAKLFPIYFSLSSISIVLQMITLKGITANALVGTIGKSSKALLISLIMTLLNQYLIEPMTTNNMMRRYDLEDTESGKETAEYKSLKSNFGKLHGISSLINLITVCAAIVHGLHLSAALIG